MSAYDDTETGLAWMHSGVIAHRHKGQEHQLEGAAALAGRDTGLESDKATAEDTTGSRPEDVRHIPEVLAVCQVMNAMRDCTPIL